MKLTSKKDLDLTAAQVYDMLADHAGWVSLARQRGIDIEPAADRPAAGIGAGWRLQFKFRGRQRKVLIWVEDLQPDLKQVYAFQGKAFEGSATLEITALSPRRTRLRMGLLVKPRTLAARLFLNTLRLARRKVEARYDKRLGQLANLIQARHAQDRAT